LESLCSVGALVGRVAGLHRRRGMGQLVLRITQGASLSDWRKTVAVSGRTISMEVTLIRQVLKASKSCTIIADAALSKTSIRKSNGSELPTSRVLKLGNSKKYIAWPQLFGDIVWHPAPFEIQPRLAPPIPRAAVKCLNSNQLP